MTRVARARRVVLMCWLALIAVTAEATVLVPVSLDELARDASIVARGRVSAVETQWAADHRGIETLVTVEVESALKGSPGGTVTFSVPGGLLGRYRTVVIGAPVFQPDDRVVVFLDGRSPAIPHLVGFSQGVFRVTVPPSAAVVAGTGRRTVVSPAGVPLVSGTGASSMPLEEFEIRVRTAAAGARP